MDIAHISVTQLTFIAYWISKAVPNLLGAAPTAIRPPEVVLHELCDGRIGSTWSEAADIWAVGCTVGHRC